jgi:predicted PurR-regulated permease PerM
MNSTKTYHPVLDIITFIAIIFIAYTLQEVIVPLLFAIILSVLVFPIVHFLEKKLRINRIFSALISIITLSLIIMIIATFVGVQMNEIASKSDQYYTSAKEKIIPLINKAEQSTGIQTEEIIESKNMKMGEMVKDNFSNITDFLLASGSILSNLVIVPLYMFFFLLYRKFFIRFIYLICTKKGNKKETKTILEKLYDVQQNYLIGLLTVMLIVGCLNSIGLLLLGIDYPFFFGFLCALLLLIPYIGIIIGSLLPALVALATKDSVWYSLGVIAVFGFIQFLEGNFITPKITGSKVSINAFVSILSIIVFSMLWGTSGMILALPVTASLKVLFDHSSKFEPIGFLLGQPNDEFLKSKARVRLKIWKEIRKNK